MCRAGDCRFIRKLQKVSSNNLISSRILPRKLGRYIGLDSLVKVLTSNEVLSEFTTGSIIMHHLVRGSIHGSFREAFFLKKHVLDLFQPMAQCHLGPINHFPTLYITNKKFITIFFFHCWNTNNLQDVFKPNSIQAFLRIPIPWRSKPDKLIWVKDPKSVFTVKFAYRVSQELTVIPSSYNVPSLKL